MKVIRYSINGFKPQYQSHHLKKINYSLIENKKEKDLYNGLNKYQIECCESVCKQHNPFYKEHYEDFKYGIWCFIDGNKDRLSLNHLKRKVPCWEAELPDDIMVYDCNLENYIRIDDERVLYGGCYIPQKELFKLKNIKRRIK